MVEINSQVRKGVESVESVRRGTGRRDEESGSLLKRGVDPLERW